MTSSFGSDPPHSAFDLFGIDSKFIVYLTKSFQLYWDQENKSQMVDLVFFQRGFSGKNRTSISPTDYTRWQ